MPDETVSFAPHFVAIGIALWSALVSFLTAKWTLKKQSKANSISDLVKLIDNLSSSASAYWLSCGRDRDREAKLKYKLKRLNMEIEDLFGRNRLYDIVDQKNRLFRQEITGGRFENEDRKAEGGRSSNIVDLGGDLIRSVKKA